jgi:CMP/dCMP kinase
VRWPPCVSALGWTPDRPSSLVIALDGPAASGKSTVGRGVARSLGLYYFDTGLLYRALTWLALQHGVPGSDADGLVELLGRAGLVVEHHRDGEPSVLVEGRDILPDLQQPAVDAAVSVVAAHSGVRDALRPVQRAVIHPPGVVMAGRDIGTIIVPEAPLKIWLSASVEERARRRSSQTGESYSAVLEGMLRRDQLDGSRSVAPMQPAADAVEVNTDGLSPQAVVERIVTLARERLGITA